MKRTLSVLIAMCLLLSVVPMSAQAASIPTREIEGKTYYDVTSKADFYNAVQLAFSNLTENLPVCYIEETRDWDSSYSNDSRNFTGIQTKSVFTYATYSPNTVCITPYPYETLEDGTNLWYGTIDVEYSDSAEELAKADAIIDGVLAKVSSYSREKKLLYIADYICAATQYGSQKLPDGGYDLINGVYELLTGVRTNIVCTSYALTFQRFMEKAGVPCYLLSNNYHAWNIVQMEDGKWYGVDCTSDNGSEIDPPHFLMGSNTMRQYSTDRLDPLAVFGKDHVVSAQDFGKAATTKAPTTTAPKAASTTEKPIMTTATKTTVKTITAKSTTAAFVTTSTSSVLSEGTPVTTDGSATDTTALTPVTTAPTQTEEKIVEVVLADQPVVLNDYLAEDCDRIRLSGDNYAWSFSAEDVDATAANTALDATIYLGDAMPTEQIEQAQTASKAVVQDREIYTFSFAHHGDLPGEAEITITVDEAFADKKVGVYSLSDSGEAVLEAVATVDASGQLSFATTHCSVWFIADYSGALFFMWRWIILAGAVVLIGVAVGTVMILRRRKRITP